ncbi:phytanoyl-CoA dioxygenase family protein [Exiguobacterium sp. ERU656]|uniref:phytanoyl-CoA dioxygenase family protein n=1 Tax=Exiguobacterium sp. ERU656 TaxID=2751217 RepID=UPI001BE7E924
MNELFQKFSNDGYCIIENFLSEQRVGSLKEQVKSIFYTEDMDCRISVNQEKLKEQGVFIGMSKKNSHFNDLVNSPEILNLLKQATNKDMNFTDDKIVFKDSSTQFASPWHQDWYYWKGSHKVSAWIALDDVTEDNGCLQVIPGSHKNRVEHNEISEDGFSKEVSDNLISSKEIVNLPVSAGSIILLDDLILHSSLPNNSLEDRWAFIPTYTDLNWDIRNIFNISK